MIINLTQHVASEGQVAAGVRDLSGSDREELVALLTVHGLPTREDLIERAKKIARLGAKHGPKSAMIGGLGALLPHLERELHAQGVAPLHAFSERVSSEKVLDDGTVVKTSEFKHMGFVPA